MRMNRLLLALTIAGFTGPFTNWASGQETNLLQATLEPASSTGRISSDTSSIHDAELHSHADSSEPDNRPEEFKTNPFDPSRGGSRITDDLRGSISDDQVTYATPSLLASQVTDATAETAEESSSIDLSTSTRRRATTTQNASNWWVETEALLWFARQSSSTPLVVTGPPGVRPTNVLAGGTELLGGGLAPGMRVNFGKWLDEDETIGVGGRVFGLFGGDSTKTFSSDAFPILGVPVFDIFSGTNEEILIASDAGLLGRDTGSMSVGSETDFFATEAYGKLQLAKNRSSRADFIGGYTFLRYDNATILRTRSIDGITNATEDGTITDTVDAFGAKNTFHGGHLGLRTEVQGSFLTLTALTKIALGNMNTRTNVFGSVTDNVPSTGVTTTNNGLFTGPNLAGTQNRDRFSFIPEIGTKLKADLTERLQFSVGYTLIVLPEVGVASDLINTTIDTGLIGLPQTPGGILRDQVSYIQGIDLGLTLKF